MIIVRNHCSHNANFVDIHGPMLHSLYDRCIIYKQHVELPFPSLIRTWVTLFECTMTNPNTLHYNPTLIRLLIPYM